MEKEPINKEKAHKDSSSTHIIWGVAIKTPTRASLLSATIISFAAAAVAFALGIMIFPKHWPLLCSYLALVVWSSFITACYTEPSNSWKHIRLSATGAILIGSLTYWVADTIILRFAR